MTIITTTYPVVINAQPEAVFAYVSDLTRHPEWSGGRLKIEAISPGPVTVGSQYLSRGDVAGQKDRPNELRVTHFETPSRFTFVANDPDFGRDTCGAHCHCQYAAAECVHFQGLHTSADRTAYDEQSARGAQGQNGTERRTPSIMTRL